jgi:hypothetical protein
LASPAVIVLLILHSTFAVEPANPTPNEKDAAESDNLRGKPKSKKPLLIQMAEEHGYALAEGEDLKRIAPPFDPIRAKYYREVHPHQAAAINDPPTSMMFYWSDRDGGLRQHSMNFGGHDLRGLFDFVADVKDQMVEGPAEILGKQIGGDWIVRVGTKDFRLIKQLEEILRRDIDLPIRLTFREQERQAFVLKGEYKFKPLDEKRARLVGDTKSRPDTIHIFAKDPVPNSGAGGGSGDFSEMLDWLGRWIAMPVVSDLPEPPTNDITWYLHQRNVRTKATIAEDRNPQLVMANFAAQTGLTFSEEKRPVRVLVVSRDEPQK